MALTSAAPELVGRHPGGALECAVEVALVGEADTTRDLGDRCLPPNQLLASGVDSDSPHELADRASVLAPKDAGEMHGMHARDGGGLAQADRFRKSFSKDFLDATQPRCTSGAANFDVASRERQQLQKECLGRQPRYRIGI